MEELLNKFQEIILIMVPEAWDRIDFYASIGNGKNVQGELFFYFLPSSFFKSEYINCYEVPSQYNIDEGDYLNLINKLYEIIKKMKKLSRSLNILDWNNISININGKNGTLKIEYSYIDFENFPFSSYERHVIWRYINLNIIPTSKEERKIIEKYYEYIKMYNIPKMVQYLNFNLSKKQGIVDYGEVLSIDEAINLNKEEEK